MAINTNDEKYFLCHPFWKWIMPVPMSGTIGDAEKAHFIAEYPGMEIVESAWVPKILFI